MKENNKIFSYEKSYSSSLISFAQIVTCQVQERIIIKTSINGYHAHHLPRSVSSQ